MRVTFFLSSVVLLLWLFFQTPLGGLSEQIKFSSKPNPIERHETLLLEEMSWIEVRDALSSGYTKVIIPTGGIEQNGPYLITGKHNPIAKHLALLVAKKLKNTLVAPVVSFVPEGNINPKSGHMIYPGTISLEQSTYEALITNIAQSLKAHGFKEIFLTADSGDNVAGLKAVASKLTKSWKGEARIYYIAESYSHKEVEQWLVAKGIQQSEARPIHDDFSFTAQLAVINPDFIRWNERKNKGLMSINGVSLEPLEKTVDWGNKIYEFRSELIVGAINKLSTTK